MQWDDLRFVLAVHRAGSLAGAARLLKTSHVTVFRRVECIEKDLGVRLFDRKRQGYVPTPAAREFLQQAEEVEERINALERGVWRQDREVRGSVRITSTDTMAEAVLPAMLARLQRAHPGVDVELDTSHTTLNISKRDADIAIRHTRAPPEMLIGHRLARVAYAVYASPRLAARYRRGGDLAALPWLAPESVPSEFVVLDWLRRQGLETRIRLRCASWMTLASVAREDGGAVILSCYLADHAGGLVRLTPVLKELEFQYWILTHPVLRDVARVAAVYAFLRAEFAGLRDWFQGGPRPR